MKKILFIHPSRKVLGKKDNIYTKESLVPSLGLASIAAYCAREGILPEIIDLRLPHRTVNDIINSIRNNRYPIVGITAFTSEITAADIIAGKIKNIFPDLPIVIGGPHVSIIPYETLFEFKNFDIAVVGEGEKTIVELLRIFDNNESYRLHDMKGIAFRKDNEIIVNSSGELIDDINSLPFPGWNFFELKQYGNILPVSTSRGCPYGCYFCTPKYLGAKVRVRSYENVVEEIEWIVYKFGVKRIQFADATFALLKNDAMRLCEELIKRGLNKRIKWDCETRADSITPELLRLMKKAGCEWVAFGVETGNEKILREIVHKGETKEQIRNAIRLAKDAGIKVRCFFIIGHYRETIETIKDTINFALELNPDALSFGLMVPNPGSEIRRLAENKGSGLRILHNKWEDYQQFNYSCFELETIPLHELKRWQAKAYFTFYLHHPFKAMRLFIESSAYNYKLKGLIKIPFILLKNFLSVRSRG